jgi:hypothetical protein
VTEMLTTGSLLETGLLFSQPANNMTTIKANRFFMMHSPRMMNYRLCFGLSQSADLHFGQIFIIDWRGIQV